MSKSSNVPVIVKQQVQLATIFDILLLKNLYVRNFFMSKWRFVFNS